MVATLRCVVALVALFGIVGCRDGEPGRGLGAPCDDQRMCRSEFSCDRGRCRAACQTDLDCGRGACVPSEGDPDAYLCTRPDERGCDESGCPSGLYCAIDTVCRIPCKTAGDCLDGAMCIEGACFHGEPQLPPEANDGPPRTPRQATQDRPDAGPDEEETPPSTPSSTPRNDCAGEQGGKATRDDCGVCDDDPDNDNTTCTLDCAGVWGGESVEDRCGVCDADPNNDDTTCAKDCAGVWGGESYEDECGACDDDPDNDESTCDRDCAGTWGGMAYVDECGVCDDDPGSDCEQDCRDEWGGVAYVDGCGVCDDNPDNDGTTCDPGLVAHWAFDESSGSSTEDSVGSLDGTIVGAPALGAPGVAGTSFGFAGSEYVSVDGWSNEPFQVSGELSTSAWYRWDGTFTGSSSVYVLGQPSASADAAFGLSIDDAASEIACDAVTTDGVARVAVASPVNRWVHVACTHDGSDLRLYLGGSLVDEEPLTGTIEEGSDNLFVGALDAGTHEISGRIDEVRVWNRALSAGEVSAQYDVLCSDERCNVPDPVAHWPLDETTGTNLADATPNGRDGTLVRGAISAQAGPMGNALLLDGSDDCVVVNDADALDWSGASRSWSAWVRLAGSGAASLFDKVDAGTGYALDVDPATGVPRLRILSTETFSLPATTSIDDDRWHHVVATFDATPSRARLFVDGNVEAEDVVLSVGDLSNALPLRLGCDASDASVVDGSMDDARVFDAALTPGQVLALFEAGGGSTCGACRVALASGLTGDFEIWTRASDGSNPRQLTTLEGADEAPAWSPLRDFIAFQHSVGAGRQIYVAGLDGSSPTALTASSGSNTDPAWSPDGTQIAFRSTRDGNSQLYVMDANGTNERRVASSDAYDSSPAWALDGTRLAFVSDRGGSRDIYVVDLVEDEVALLFDAPSNAEFIEWSPEGRRIAFAQGNDGPSREITIVDVDANGVGSNPRQLTDDSFEDSHPSWDPSGEQLVWQSSRDGIAQVWRMDADGSNPTKLSTGTGRELQPHWASSAGARRTISASWLSLTVAAEHACARRRGSTLECWGLADDDRTLAPAGAFLHVSAGGGHTCGVRFDGDLECWGLDDAVRAPPAGAFIQVAVSPALHACAIANDDTLACWGSNVSGERMPPGGSFLQVTSGTEFSCAIADDDTVTCWGRSLNGAPTTETFRQISAGGSFACGIQMDDTLACWGDDGDGQATPPGGTFRHVSAGSTDRACAVSTDDVITCWGRPGLATPPASASGFLAVGVGGDHACALRANGSIACWGDDADGRSSPP